MNIRINSNRPLYTLLFILAILAACFQSCSEKASSETAFTVDDLRWANTRLLQTAMRDNFNPPQASRVYVYPHLAHYLTLENLLADSLPSISSNLNDWIPLQLSVDSRHVDPYLAALMAFCKTGRKVVFSEHYMESMVDTLIGKAKAAGYSDRTIEHSSKYADEIFKHLATWIDGDNYIQTRTQDRFTSSVKPWEWRETPPDYTAALEPNWPKIRTIIIPSADFYTAPRPPEYSKDKSSSFYKMVNEVYEESLLLDSLKELTAWFWDDNPNITEHVGHLMTKTHKFAPPGHWMNIITQVSEKENCSYFKLTEAYTFTALAMFDGIISCWNEKYKTNLVRPITYIKEYIDPFWSSLIQTPPFPEYTSGHSVVSAAAAEILTRLFGDNYAFTDRTQLLFDMEERSFDSFHQAAWEVSLSRFYGGIHYMQGIREGNLQGKYIGAYVYEKIHDEN